MLKTSIRAPNTGNLIIGGTIIDSLYKELNDDQATKAPAKQLLEEAVTLGITYFDISPVFGPRCTTPVTETYMPKEINGMKIKISTKCGVIIKRQGKTTDQSRHKKDSDDCFTTENMAQHITVEDYSHEGILESVKQCKERLSREFIDCLRLHGVDNEDRFLEATAPGAAIDTMVELRSKGEIGEVSLELKKSRFLPQFVKNCPAGTFNNIQIPGSWNLINQDGYNLMVECQKMNIKVTIADVFAHGLLATTNNDGYSKSVALDIRYKLEKWKGLCKKYKMDMPVVALCFTVLPTLVEYVIIEIRDISTLQEIVKLLNKCSSGVPLELWKEAQKEGLIRHELKFPF